MVLMSMLLPAALIIGFWVRFFHRLARILDTDAEFSAKQLNREFGTLVSATLVWWGVVIAMVMMKGQLAC